MLFPGASGRQIQVDEVFFKTFFATSEDMQICPALVFMALI